MPAFFRARACISIMIGPSLVGSSSGVTVGPRCQPSAIASSPLPASTTRPVKSDELQAGDPHHGGRNAAGMHRGFLFLGTFALAFRHTGQRLRGDGVDGHAVPLQFPRRDHRERGDARLRRAIVGLARCCRKSRTPRTC